MAGPRFNPTLFDKLVSDIELSGLRQTDDPEERTEITRASLRFYTVPKLDRFNETALRTTVRRELAWLLNTTNLDAVEDLSAYPQVRTSVLNYGVPDLTGKSMSTWAIRERANQIREAVKTFEPRIEPTTLDVEVRATDERENAVTFVIRGDISSAVKAVPVQFVTDVEVDTGAATVRD